LFTGRREISLASNHDLVAPAQALLDSNSY